MRIKKFKKVISDNDDINGVQSNVEQVFEYFKDIEILDGQLIKDITVSSAAAGTQIEHKLNRAPVGWIVTDINGNATVWKLAQTSRVLTLRASSQVTVSLYVF